MAAIIYDGKAIIPAPFVSIVKEYINSEDGEIVGKTYQIVLKGKIVPHMGSPNSSGSFWTLSGYPADETLTVDQNLKSILNKQQALRALFSQEGKTLEIQPWDGSQSTKCNPRVKRIEFPEGNWFNLCDYAITLEADLLDPDTDEDAELTYKISRASEDWQVEQADETGRTWRLSHTVSAAGKRFYDETGSLTAEAWENAREWVLTKLGINTARLEAPGVLDAPDLQAYNYVRNQQVGEKSGSFSVSETWLAISGEDGAIEDFTVTSRTDESGRTRVSVEGQVRGLETRDNHTYAFVTSRFDNADAKWTTVQSNIFTRAQTYSGETLHSIPLSTQVGENVNTGVITYTYEYDNRPTSSISGAVSEIITVNDVLPADLFAQIAVLGRTNGPILQDTGANTGRKRTVSIEAVLTASSQTYTPTQPDTDAVVLAYLPVATIMFVEADQVSWNATNGRYTRSTTFTYEV